MKVLKYMHATAAVMQVKKENLQRALKNQKT